jgi:uncharacterized damage-inducible protein DinB
VISVDELLAACDSALHEYAAICRELGDDLVNARLDGVPGSNSASAIVTHVNGVMAYWGSTVNRGVVVPRDRDAEFEATGTVEELTALLDAGRSRLHEDVRASSPREAPANPPDDGESGDTTQGAVLLHVYEELTQHLGQLEVTRDVLLARRA